VINVADDEGFVLINKFNGDVFKSFLAKNFKVTPDFIIL